MARERGFYNIIKGECRPAEEHEQCIDPRTGEKLWKAPIASAEDLDDAVKSARKAFRSWSKSTIADRTEVLRDISKIFVDHKSELVETIVKETGKSRLLSETEVGSSAMHVAYYAQNYLSDQVTFEDAAIKIIATHAPLGVVAAIIPWNSPLLLSVNKIASALITGNCVIVKPSPLAPYTVLRFVQLCQSYLPPGMLQAVNGGADLGAAMTAHPGVDHISFTGSTAAGKKVMAACAGSLKRVTLELGGNDAAVVCADVDIATAAYTVAAGCFFNAGQMCVATKRVYVHEFIYDQFMEAFLDVVQKQFGRVDDVSVSSVFGPISNKRQYDLVQGFVDDTKAKGYNVVSGGGQAAADGLWISPIVVSRPPEDSLLVTEEQFGPIVPIMSWRDEADVIRRANATKAGLGAAVYSRDLAQAERMARSLEAGTVWINMAGRPHPAAFMAGRKETGIGGELGVQGLLSYCHTQSLHFAKDG